jgi:signal peptidase I
MHIRRWRRLGTWLRDLVASTVLAVFAILFLYQPVRVEGTSMMPSIKDQERIFISKFVHRLGFGEVERGDLIVFFFPGDPSKSYIKRAVGLPGDTVEVRQGVLFVNDRIVDEPYVQAEYRDQSSVRRVAVPANHYYVLGDHRTSSNDSRSWGPVPHEFVYGKAVFSYWPLEKAGLLR